MLKNNVIRYIITEEGYALNKEKIFNILRSVTNSIATTFVNSLKDDTHKQALETIDNLEKISQQEFENLVAERISVLDDFEQKEAIRVIEKIKIEWDTEIEKGLSLRETILLNIQSMIKSHAYSKHHQSELDIIEFDKLININFKLYDLNAKEILFLWYINNHNIENLNIAGYWTHTYHLNYQIVLERLFACRYLEFGTIYDTLSIYKVSELKGFLKAHSIPVTGKKQELINRIIDNCNEKDILSTFSARVLKITQNGQNIIDENDCIIYFHQRSNYFNISIDYVFEMHKKFMNMSKYELAINIFKKECATHLLNRNYGLYRNSIFCISLIYKDMQNYINELEILLQVCYLDLVDQHPFLAPGIISAINENENYRLCAPKELYDIYLRSVNKLPAELKKFRNVDIFEKINDALQEKAMQQTI